MRSSADAVRCSACSRAILLRISLAFRQLLSNVTVMGSSFQMYWNPLCEVGEVHEQVFQRDRDAGRHEAQERRNRAETREPDTPDHEEPDRHDHIGDNLAPAVPGPDVFSRGATQPTTRRDGWPTGWRPRRWSPRYGSGRSGSARAYSAATLPAHSRELKCATGGAAVKGRRVLRLLALRYRVLDRADYSEQCVDIVRLLDGLAARPG